MITTTPGPDCTAGVPVIRLAARLLPRFQVSFDPRAYFRLGGLLKQDRFDVVHVHSSIISASPLAYATTFWCQRLHIANVLTSHSVWKNTTRLAWLLRHCSKAAFERTQWTTVSRHTARGMERAGLPNVTVLPNGIDVAAWKVERKIAPELRVTSVMRMNIKKRPQDLVRAPYLRGSAGLAGARATLPVRFTLVGDGPYRRHVERLAEQLGLGDSVEFAGRLSREQIKKVFEQTDLFVLPTVLEAFGIAVLEARCAGLPAVVIGSSGAAELIQDGIQGRLAADRHEMAAIIAQLLGDPAARRRMSQNARGKVEQFDWSRVIPMHLDVYRRAMGKSVCAAPQQPIDARQLIPPGNPCRLDVRCPGTLMSDPVEMDRNGRLLLVTPSRSFQGAGGYECATARSGSAAAP